MIRCVHCGKTVPQGSDVCPACGAEQPIQWVVTLVYFLAFLFVQGVIYRLLWPNANSFPHYLVYFLITLAIGVTGYLAWKRYRQG
jgi:predicted nucleic acid-binding Zn ribbon protein